MKFAMLIPLTAGAMIGAELETILRAERVAHTMALSQVYLNGHGPFRMMLDTGAAASAIRPEIARRIGAQPRYRVEQVTAAGVTLALAGPVTVRVGAAEDIGVEFLQSAAGLPGVDGVLGQSWLSLHSYQIDFRKRQVILDGDAPSAGIRLALQDSDGRPSIAALVDGTPQELVLDSGASVLLLFRSGSRFARRVTLGTHTGFVEAGAGSAVVAIGGFRKAMQATELPDQRGAGLMPASVFRSIYVSKGRGLAVLAP